MRTGIALATFIGAGIAFSTAMAHVPHVCPDGIADRPALSGHLEHDEIDSGAVGFSEIFAHGKEIFHARFNICDGQGRPAATGCDSKRDPLTAPDFTRVSGPDSNSCAGCHNQPRPGGSGDFAATQFVLAFCADPVAETVLHEDGNPRNPPELFGVGLIERLAIEIGRELAVQTNSLADGWQTLTSKGIEFEVFVEGGVVVDAIGILPDLVVRPFDQTGRSLAIRPFTAVSITNHFGIQVEEAFDLLDLGPDFDEDGVDRELTVGDMSALTVYQAALATPARVLPADPQSRAAVRRGEETFAEIGCARCHVPEMELDSAIYPIPQRNEQGQPVEELPPAFIFDMTTTGETPRPQSNGQDGAIVRPYTDFKWHNLCDSATDANPIRTLCTDELRAERDFMLNEAKELRPGREFFFTRRLWAAGSSAPYGHDGTLTTLTEAILAHGGDARATRDAFVALSDQGRLEVVKFLKSLRALTDTRLLTP